MITVHHLENSRSQRIPWLLEELGLPYEVRHYRRDPETSLAPPELIAVHPLGKSPVVTDTPGRLMSARWRREGRSGFRDGRQPGERASVTFAQSR